MTGCVTFIYCNCVYVQHHRGPGGNCVLVHGGIDKRTPEFSAPLHPCGASNRLQSPYFPGLDMESGWMPGTLAERTVRTSLPKTRREKITFNTEHVRRRGPADTLQKQTELTSAASGHTTLSFWPTHRYVD